jgi:hypothetical protein
MNPEKRWLVFFPGKIVELSWACPSSEADPDKNTFFEREKRDAAHESQDQ